MSRCENFLNDQNENEEEDRRRLQSPRVEDIEIASKNLNMSDQIENEEEHRKRLQNPRIEDIEILNKNSNAYRREGRSME